MKFKLNYCYALVCLSSLFASQTTIASNVMVKDSVGLTRDGNRTYVMYKIQPKQTLYSILKRYGSNLNEFKAANPGATENVQIGQVVRIPYKGFASSPRTSYFNNATTEKTAPATAKQSLQAALPSNASNQPVLPKTVTHTVDAGQTLYTIANKYHISPTDLRKWNNLPSEHLDVGQVLVIDPVQASKTQASASTANAAVPTSTMANYQPTAVSQVASAPTSVLPPAPAASLSDADRNTIETMRSAAGYKKTIETGYAELIDVEDKSGKYLGLHRSVPVGTLINVKNVANGQSIWVKIIGRLPDVGTDKVIIKLSPRAFEKLAPADKKIRAEINYTTN